jgi:mitochondrial fission protein ELM1
VTGLLAWAVTTGAVGMRTQARGLAEAVAGEAVEKTVGIRFPWSLLPGSWAPSPEAVLDPDPDLDRLEPPWPDLMVTCGRKSAAAAVAVKRASGGRTLAVHVQDPLTDPRAFDLVVAMPHDRVSGPNVLKVDTALHDLTSAKLAEAAKTWKKPFAPLGRPLLGVVVGGSTKANAFTAAQAQVLLERIDRVRSATGAGVAVTPSPRTPPEVLEMINVALAHDPRAFVWDREGPNPYRGILALADRLVVTSDSVSMISEAVSTPHPVEVFDLGESRRAAIGGARHADFLDRLVEDRLVRRFEGEAEPPATAGQFNATDAAAEAVRRLLRDRGRLRP